MEKEKKKSRRDRLTLAEGVLNFTELFHSIWLIRRRIYKSMVVGAVLGLLFSFTIPKKFMVNVTLSPEMGTRKSGGSLASLASSFLGGGMSSSGGDALNALLAPEIVSSTPFLLELLDAKVSSSSIGVDTTYAAYLDSESSSLLNKVISVPGRVISGIKSIFYEAPSFENQTANKGSLLLSAKEAILLAKLRSNIKASIDQKRGVITLDVSSQDPFVAATIADSVVNKLQTYIINYKIAKAKEDYNYWEKLTLENKEKFYIAQQAYADFVDANNNVILQSTAVERERLQNEMSLAYQGYTQVAQQLQMAQAKMQESKPAFFVVEPAVVPLVNVATRKSVIIMAFIFISLCLVISWHLFLNKYYVKLKNIIKEVKGEESITVADDKSDSM